MNGHKIVNQNNIHFITPTVVGWLDVFTRKRYKDIVIESLQYCQKNKGLIIYAYVIMSNHLHLVVEAKKGYVLSDIIRDFKKYVATKILSEINGNPIESRQEWMMRLFKYFAKYNKNNQKYQFWQIGNHPVDLGANDWFWQKVNYIHLNPVRAGIVDNMEDYRYSSASNYFGKEGLIDVVVCER